MDEIQSAIFERLVSDLSDQIRLQNISIEGLKEAVEAQNEATNLFANKINNLEKIPAEVRIRQTYSIPLFGKKLTTFFVSVLLTISIGALGTIWYYYDDFKILQYSKTVTFKEKDTRTVFEVLQSNSKQTRLK